MLRFSAAGVVALVVLIGFANEANAQNVNNAKQREAATESSAAMPSGAAMTPEMWLYMQEQERYQDPKEAVRRKAELRTAQRQRRLESQRWFGFMNLRPPANPVPFYGSYSHTWVGSGRNVYNWHGIGHPYVTYHISNR